MSNKCLKCGRFTRVEDYDEFHRVCESCDLFFCFDVNCHCIPPDEEGGS